MAALVRLSRMQCSLSPRGRGLLSCESEGGRRRGICHVRKTGNAHVLALSSATGDHLSRRQHPTCRARLACERSEAVLSSTRARAVSKTAMAPAGSDVAAVAASDVEERVGDLTEAGHAYGLHQDREQVVASEGGV